jgi:predicted nucleic acid-binding protein
MGGELLYLDSSALVKLVLPEAEREALLASLSDWPVRVTSELARVEVVRATRRATAQPGAEQRAEEVLAGLHLLKVDDDIQRGRPAGATEPAVSGRPSPGLGPLAGSRSGGDRDL